MHCLMMRQAAPSVLHHVMATVTLSSVLEPILPTSKEVNRINRHTGASPIGNIKRKSTCLICLDVIWFYSLIGFACLHWGVWLEEEWQACKFRAWWPFMYAQTPRIYIELALLLHVNYFDRRPIYYELHHPIKALGAHAIPCNQVLGWKLHFSRGSGLETRLVRHEHCLPWNLTIIIFDLIWFWELQGDRTDQRVILEVAPSGHRWSEYA